LSDPSLWNESLAEFYTRTASKAPGPAGVAAAAVTARLGLALLIKVLTIRGTRNDLIEAAQREADALAQAADDDIRAVQALLAAQDSRAALEVPMRAARAAVAGLELCKQASGSIQGLIAADLDAAGALLRGAARAILICVEANLKRSPDEAIAAECRRLSGTLRG
jgi:formiminotetrahydrofolate cyclodeaminase